MALTLIQKLIGRKTGNGRHAIGEVVRVSPDLVMASGCSMNEIIRKFYQSGMQKVEIADRMIVVNNASPVESSHQTQDTWQLQSFVRQQQIGTYYELGRSGFPSNVVLGNGHIVPGMLTVSAEYNFAELGVMGAVPVLASEHEMALMMVTGEFWIQIPPSARFDVSGKLGPWITGTDIGLHILKNYQLPDNKKCVLEFSGDGITALPLHERFNLARILSSYGYELVLFEPDQQVLEYLNSRTDTEAFFEQADEKAEYAYEYEVNLNTVVPMIAWSVEGEEVSIAALTDKEGQHLDKIITGGCGSGRFEDFKIALNLVKYNLVHPDLQMLVIPADNSVFADLVNTGLAGIFIELGCEIYPASAFKTFRDGLGVYTKAADVLTSSPELFNSARQTEGHKVYLGSILSCFGAAAAGELIHPKALELKLKSAYHSEHDHDSDDDAENGHKH